MKILFLGTYVPDQYADQIPMLSAAGNQFQYNLVSTLKKKHEVHSLSYIAVPTDGVVESHAEEIREEEISVFLPRVDGFLKALMSFRRSLRTEAEWADCVIAYNSLYPWFWIRSKKRKILILADYTPAEEESGVRHKMMSMLMRLSFAQYNRYVVLSEKSRQYLRKDRNVLVVNGAIRWENFSNIQEPVPEEERIVFLYSGVLNRVTGLDLLLRAFQMTQNQNYRLIICGQGDELSIAIEDSCRKDKRISYKGYVSKKEYYELLEQANVVVNPRNMNLLQNRYNFPSKVLEYIASGRVVLSTKFSGYQNYEKYLLFAESDERELCRMMDAAAEEAKGHGEEVYHRNRNFARQLDWDNVADLFARENVNA